MCVYVIANSHKIYSEKYKKKLLDQILIVCQTSPRMYPSDSTLLIINNYCSITHCKESDNILVLGFIFSTRI